MKQNKINLKSVLSFMMIICILSSLIPSVFAAQSNEYVDPADSWLTSNNRTNEFDVNATITNETGYCNVCRKETTTLTYRVPEYTRSGETALNRSVMYSDGTLMGGEGKGNLDSGTPGVDAYYTGSHWTKLVCQTCGTMNSCDGPTDYCFNNNVYSLNTCANNFFLDFDNTIYEPSDDEYHLTTLKKGEYCKFCKGTYARATKGLEEHNFTEQIDGQVGNNRFYIYKHCNDCGYDTSSYVTAKSVITSYYGNVDGQAHTLTVSDLSEKGVNTSIRYGDTAESCTKTSAPNYTEAGYYTVYYKINYTYAGETMTENGVSYVWLVDDSSKSDTVIVVPAAHEHDYHYLETVKPNCDNLGYDRFQCNGCGDLIKTNYTQSTGHKYKAVTIKEATCEQGGLKLWLCSECGDFYEETTPVANHKYTTVKHNPTCRVTGYTEHICDVCNDNYITDITPIVSHSFERVTKEPTCTDRGYTTSTCTMCNYHQVSDYTEPLGHKWDEGHTVTSSTCTGEGVIEYNCTNEDCTEKMIKATDANGHTPGDAATCTEPQICTVCKTVLDLPTGHTYTEGIVNPTCTSMGYTLYTCHCGDSYVGDYTDITPHRYAEDVTAPNCTEHGFTTYICKDCDHTYVSDYTEKAKHNYTATVTAPTCTSMGYTTYVCADCNDTYTSDYVDMIEHNYNKAVTEPTCTEHGYAVYTCPDCGKSYIGDYTDCKEHQYIITVIEPTCTTMGYTIYKCNDCEDEYKAEYIEALGHTPSEWIIDTPATIENAGEKHIECSVCGEILMRAALSQLIDRDFSDEDGNVVVGDYTIKLYDKDNMPISDAEVTIDITDRVEIKLPDGRLLDYNDQTIIVASKTDTNEPVKDLFIFTQDKNNNKATGVTNADGVLKVPNDKSSTGDDNGTIGKGDEDKTTYVVRVTDKTNTIIPSCDVYIGESNNLVVDLPDGVKPTQSEPVIITVTDQNGNAQEGVTVIALGMADYIEKGKTDIYGKVTLPITSEGYTDEAGKVNVNNINVIVNDEIGVIMNAYVKHNEDNTISVSLPMDKLISYTNRITVTVLDSMAKPIPDVSVSVKDVADVLYTANTDENGRIVVPPLSEDYTDINGYSEVDGYIVTVVSETGAIEKAYIKHNDEVKNDNGVVETAENISIVLSKNVKFDYTNRITVTVLHKADNTPVKDIEVIVSEAPTTDVEPKTLKDKTNDKGVAVYPSLSEDVTDDKGDSGVTEEKPDKGEDTDGDGTEDKPGEVVTTSYVVKVNDTKGVIIGAFIEIKDGKVTVTLPDTHTLTTANQTTVTVLDKDSKPVANVSVTVKDATTEKSGTTNSNGQVTVPVKTSSGGGGGTSSRPSSGGGGGGGSVSTTAVNVKVTDKDGKTVNVSKSTGTDKVTLTLPTGKNLEKDDNYYTITVTDRNGKAKYDYTVVLKDRNKNELAGKTDKNGVTVLPAKEHKAYIEGYNDGTFRPDNDMSRAEAAAIFARLIAEEKGEKITGQPTFKDVSSELWYAPYIGYLEKYHIIEGYNDKTFKPESQVTRAEFVTMAVRYYDLFNDIKKTGYIVKYTDVSTDYWAYDDIAFAKNIGWLNGYADGTFRGDNNITRAEVVTVVNRATGRTPDEDYITKNVTTLNRFTDLKNNLHWGYLDIMEAANNHNAAVNSNGEAWVK